MEQQPGQILAQREDTTSVSQFNESTFNFFNKEELDNDYLWQQQDKEMVKNELEGSYYSGPYSSQSQHQGADQFYDQKTSDLLFTEDIPEVGTVPMRNFSRQALVFYIPKVKGFKRCSKLVEDAGGIVVQVPDCCSIQLCPIEDEKKDLKKYFSRGEVYKMCYVLDCMAYRRVLDRKKNEKYILFRVKKDQGKEISFSRTKFTIREIIKIFDVIENNPSKRTKNPAYWQRIIEKGMFPGRSVHSINAQWQRYSLYQYKSEAVKQAIKMNMPYCVSFKQIPDHLEAIQQIKKELKDQSKQLKHSFRALHESIINRELLSSFSNVQKEITTHFNYDEDSLKESSSEGEEESHQGNINQDNSDSEIPHMSINDYQRQKLDYTPPKVKIEESSSYNKGKGNLMKRQVQMQKMEYMSQENKKPCRGRNQRQLKRNAMQMETAEDTELQLRKLFAEKITSEDEKLDGSIIQSDHYTENETTYPIQNGEAVQNEKHHTRQEEIKELDLNQKTQLYMNQFTPLKEEQLSDMSKLNQVEQNRQRKNRELLSYKFSSIDFHNQIKNIQDPNNHQKKSSAGMYYPASVRNESMLTDSNPCIYTRPFKDQLKEFTKQIQIQVNSNANSPKQGLANGRRITLKKVQSSKANLPTASDKKGNGRENEFNGDESLVPNMSRLLHLYEKYCSMGQFKNKSFEDLQKDLYSVNNDMRILELFLKGNKVQYWTELEDYILEMQQDHQGNQEYQILIKTKGPEEVQKRRDFLNI